MTLLERLEERWERMDGAAATKIDRILKERREASDEIKRLRAALRLFVDMPEKFEEAEFLNGIGQMRRAFDTAKAVLQPQQ